MMTDRVVVRLDSVLQKYRIMDESWGYVYVNLF